MSDPADTSPTTAAAVSDAGPTVAAPDLPGLEDADEKQVASRLAMAFATLVAGQTVLSESDYPYDPFWIELDPRTRLSRKVFCDLLGLIPSREMVMGPPSTPPGPGEPGFQDDLDYVLVNILLISMRSLLGDLTQVLARGENIVQVPYFLFGRLKTGALVGVRSIKIET